MGKFSGPNKVKNIVRTDDKDYALTWKGLSNDYGGVEVYSTEELDLKPDPYYKLDFTREDIKKEKEPFKNLYYFLIGLINNHGEEREIFIENFMTDKFLSQFLFYQQFLLLCSFYLLYNHWLDLSQMIIFFHLRLSFMIFTL